MSVGVPPESHDERTLRSLGVTASLFGGAVCLVWAVAVHHLGKGMALTGTGILEMAMAAVLLGNAGALYIHRRLKLFAVVGVAALQVFPHLLCWSTGGLAEGSIILVWALMAPLMAALLLDARAVAWTLAAFVVLGCVTAFSLPVTSGLLASAPEMFVRVFYLANLLLTAMFVTLTVLFLLRKRVEATQALSREHDRSEALLLNILPSSIARRLKDSHSTIAERHEEATILFADIVGFTELSARLAPEELVMLLNTLFSEFDQLVEKHGLEKIKTIGDAYMVVGGLPLPQPDHAARVAALALDMLDVLARQRSTSSHGLEVRIGINSGPVVAGVIGRKKFIYDLWGDAVNLASRMESHGVRGAIHVSDATQLYLRDQFVFEDRGQIHVKGKGEMRTWLLTGRVHPA